MLARSPSNAAGMREEQQIMVWKIKLGFGDKKVRNLCFDDWDCPQSVVTHHIYRAGWPYPSRTLQNHLKDLKFSNPSLILGGPV
jgi:hypothetical protein